MDEYVRVKACINLKAIHENVSNAKALLKPGTLLMAIIKADGYGHGSVEVAKCLDDIADAYGVAVLSEALALREAGIKKPILILGYTPKDWHEQLITHEIRTAVFTYELAEELSREAVELSKEAHIHIAVDTGMSRIGFMPNEESADIIEKIHKLPNIRIEGIFTHFATMDEKDKTYAKMQLKRFNDFCEMLENKGIHIPVKHASNSAGIIECPEANLDMVRDGISVYGLYPSEDVDKSKLELTPAMEIKAYVSYVKELDEGISVGYGATYTTTKKTTVATIPVGYADGYPRSLSNKGSVLIRGKRAPIIGRVCMDQFMVDVTDLDSVTVGDEVTLIGKDGEEFLSVEEVSGLAGSFNYELCCDISPRVPRYYIK